MSVPLWKYNPAFLTDDELIKTFVVRLEHLKMIVQTISENTGPSNQHVLVVGPRGIGKTMLVLRVAAEVRTHPDLTSRVYPLVFGEEIYQAISPGQFWHEALYHLHKQTNDQRLLSAFKDLKKEKDEDRLRLRSLAQLMDFADQEKKRIVLIVENLDMLLSQLGEKDAWTIRHTLLNEPRIMLLGTAVNDENITQNLGKAFFEAFKLINLEPLTNDQAALLWKELSGEELKDSRVTSLRIMTGFNPRLMGILSSFHAGKSFQYLMDNFLHLVDDHTDYLKHNIESLPSEERKIFLTLADIWDPVTASRVADEARMDVNRTSSFLGRLHKRGYVEIVPHKGRKKHYQVRERLYNIYHLMRRGGHYSARVQGLLRILTYLHEKEDFPDIWEWISEEACSLSQEKRMINYCALETLLKDYFTEPDLRYKAHELIPDRFYK